MKMAEKCADCGGEVGLRYVAMAEWKVQGTLCGRCYSKRLHGHYPGEHVRV